MPKTRQIEKNKEAIQMGSITCALHYFASYSVVDVVEFDS